MLDALPEAWLLACLGFAGGLILGLAARLGGFCTLGVIEDALYGGSLAKFGMWLWALGLAIAGSAVCIAYGIVDRELSIFAMSSSNWLSAVMGGLMFGYGMALAGTCGFTALARFGSGDLRAFVILLVIGISAYITIGGPLAYMRVWLNGDQANPGWIDQELGSFVNAPPTLIALILSGLLLTGSMLIRGFRSDRTAILWSSAVALAIIGGWVGTSYVATAGFGGSIVASHSFSAPIGQSLLYLMTATGTQPNFGIGSVLGVVSGAFLGSLFKGRFSWEACDDPRELSRQLLGAGLMGSGAVLSFGCSIGQGLTGMAVLNWTAPVVLLCIVVGAVFGIKQLVHGLR